jgi:Rit1-like protein
MLYAGASFGARVLQKHRWSSRKLVLQPPPPEYTSTVRRCHPWRVRSHHRITRSRQFSSQTSCPRLILVDSTRAGKRLPDALSKTVPIWCAVINRAIRLRGGFVDTEVPSPSSLDFAAADTDLDLHTPPGSVSPHEHSQIAARLDSWAAALAVSHVFAAPSCALASPQRTHRTRRMHFRN